MIFSTIAERDTFELIFKTRCFKATDLWEYRKSMVHTLCYWLFVLLVLRFMCHDIFQFVVERFCAREFDAMHEFGT